ncbi:uncharacterized protein [Diadema antillarum]|uniref:uncharacterized protein n=1 Tax=Diadema antillarum TaxID=105358 RepID=UPI003A8B6A4D
MHLLRNNGKICIFVAFLAVAHAGYFPPALFGNPINAKVVSLDPPDFRGEPVYRIDYQIITDDGQTQVSFIHRQYTEFQKFDAMIPWYHELNLPSKNTATLSALNEYMQRLLRRASLVESQLFHDFLGINWDGNDIDYFKNFVTFMKMILVDRLPAFQPEPPVFETLVDGTGPITAFENYLFVQAFRRDEFALDEYLAYLQAWMFTTPSYTGEEGDSDVWAPGVTESLALPYHYTKTSVHFMPDGYQDPHSVRLSYMTNNKYNFLDEELIKTWVRDLHSELKPVNRVLDIGSGNCYSTFSYGELYPNAEVIGIDLAAPYVRFCRVWNEERGMHNVNFYHGNGEYIPFANETFDIVQFTYVLHEMPAENARRVLNEAFRVLRPGGALSGFDVWYWTNPTWREYNVERNTWGYHWNETGLHGPEPYMEEYQEGLVLPDAITEAGFIDSTVTRYTNSDGVYLAYKPIGRRKRDGQ